VKVKRENDDNGKNSKREDSNSRHGINRKGQGNANETKYLSNQLLSLHLGYGRNRPDLTHIFTGCLPVHAQPQSKIALAAKAALEFGEEEEENDDPNAEDIANAQAQGGRPKRKKALESREMIKRFAGGEDDIKKESIPDVVTRTRSGRQSRKPHRTREYDSFSDEDYDDRPTRKKKRKTDGGFRRPRVEPLGGEFDIVVKLHIATGLYEVNQNVPLNFSVQADTGDIIVESRTVDAQTDKTPFSKILVGDVLIAIDGEPITVLNSFTPHSLTEHINQRLNSRANCVYTFKAKRHLIVERVPQMLGTIIDPQQFFDAVDALGGFQEVHAQKQWQNIRRTMDLKFTTSSGNILKKAYLTYFQDLILS